MSATTKEGVIALLEERKFDELAGLVAGKKGILRYLNRLLFERETLLRWRAVEAMGAVADRLAGEDPEAVRVILRSLFWSINDESGGIGWSAPECIGEIIYRRPGMFGEFASIIISHAEEEMLRRGVLWAAGRIAQAEPGLVREEVKDLAGYLDDPDPAVRGYTIRFLNTMGEGPDPALHRPLLEDGASVPLYEDGRLYEVRVAELARSWFFSPENKY
ncbi:MAG: HEAT repeat domain-containing protein [Firmicutes bacterium]|nr:HEAT repeat domain-containing protein [Bacillota bacterium]MCL5058035.1 HEAT repeat domain-containing protein [Actinomycetota bacterium]